MKKLLVTLLVLLLLFVSTSHAAVKKGDADVNGIVDINDLIMVINQIVNNQQSTSFDNADVDNSGSIDVIDLSRIVDIIFRTNPPQQVLVPDDEAAANVSYITGRGIDYNADHFSFYFQFLDDNRAKLICPVYVDIQIINSAGIEVYKRTHVVNAGDFDTSMTARTKIYYDAIKPGSLNDGKDVDEGTLYYKVYAPKNLAFDVYDINIYKNLPYTSLSSTCTLTMPELPSEYTYAGYAGTIYSKVNITDVRFEFEDDYSKERVHLYLYFTGEKTYDRSGPGQSSRCKVGWKLLRDGYVVKTGTYYSPSIAEGEKFKDDKQTVYSLEPGNYELILLNVN